ncbi:hypothetical protein B9Z55_017727 [Caenorhabditis nigoni]|uniref:Uncharacterized protein n=1 Tax=Caenorhabditis nigoni TaxID=1611254 RepID=A0A2G5TBC4_9PELO|nr:hypothetical protein B9Z55_017727 [Caenorhabditis nigoni]
MFKYVKLPIVRIYRRAVPIPTFDGRHCILASDLLFEILRDMCSVLNVFQKVTQDNWSVVEDCFNNLAETFDEKLRPFFIDTEKSERVRKQCEDYFEKHLGSSQVNMISEVPETGFTVRDLKENVKYLGLENAFPNIMDFAEFSHSVVKTISGKMTLDTRDMFTALEICQLNCILPKLPKLERFVHNQGACGHVCYQCSKCPPFMPEDFFKPILRKWIRSRTSELSQSFFAPEKEDVEQTNDNLEAETGSSDEIKNSEFPTSSEDKENMPNPSKDEKCDNFEMFEEELQELIGYYVYEKERTCNKWGKNNRILDGSMKRFGPYELSEEIRELFNKQFDRIMTQSGWDIKNCQPDDDCRTWPWFTHKEHDNND